MSDSRKHIVADLGTLRALREREIIAVGISACGAVAAAIWGMPFLAAVLGAATFSCGVAAALIARAEPKGKSDVG